MRSSRQGAIPSEIGKLIDDLDAIKRRLSILETPSGEALSSTVAKLQALVSDIQAQLDAWTASRWTNAQITSQINSTVNSTIASTLGGSVTIGGNLLVNGTLRAPDAVAFSITGTRRTAWLEDATGRLGYATSTIAAKTGIRDADEQRLARLLDIVPKSYMYREEVRRRTRLRINDGVDYVPARELGIMAEDLDAAGFHEFVIYDGDGVPEGVEYSMLAVALLAAARLQRDEIAEIRAHVGLGSKA